MDTSATRDDEQRERSAAWEELTVRYLTDLPRQLDALYPILERGNYATIRSHAHRIKGTSGTYRLEAIALEAGELESAAAKEDDSAVRDAIGRVRERIEGRMREFDGAAGAESEANG